jgi:hypothetical protein
MTWPENWFSSAAPYKFLKHDPKYEVAVLSQLFLAGVEVDPQGVIRVWLIERLMFCHGARKKSVKVG